MNHLVVIKAFSSFTIWWGSAVIITDRESSILTNYVIIFLMKPTDFGWLDDIEGS